MEQVEHNFSEELIKECQKVIFKKSGKKITPGEADMYLDSFARLGNLAVRFIEMKEAEKQKNKFF